MTEHHPTSRAERLSALLTALLADAPDLDAAAVLTLDGLPMASALPTTMDEDRVAAMSAALLALGARAASDLGRGPLSQVFVQGEHGTLFLVPARDEAVLVAVAAEVAKVGMMMYEVKRAAAAVAAVLADGPSAPAPLPVEDAPVEAVPELPVAYEPVTPELPAYVPVALETPTFEPVPYEPVVFEPASFEPASFEPAPYEPVAYEPVSYEPVSYEPVSYEPVAYEPVAVPEPADLPTYEPVALEPAPYAPAAVDVPVYDLSSEPLLYEALTAQGVSYEPLPPVAPWEVPSSEPLLVEQLPVEDDITPTWAHLSGPADSSRWS